MPTFASLVAFVGNPAWDILVIIFFLAMGFLWGAMPGGKSKLLSFLFALYCSLLMSPAILSITTAGVSANVLYRELGVYGGVLVVLFIFFERTLFRNVLKTGYRWWQAFLLSFFEVGLFMAAALSVASTRGNIEFSQITVTLFSGQIAYLVWLAAPLVGLYLISRAK